MANILVVDDLEPIRDVLSGVLTKNGHRVSEAASGEEAVALVQEDIFDIAIVDFRMGGLDGLDLLKVVKEISPDTEIIMLTGHATIDTAVRAMRLGVYDFVTKPINMEELTLIINRVLESKELADSVRVLRTQAKERYRFPDIIGNASSMLAVFALMERVCQFDSAVLITGESGTGKELVARAIYDNGPRSDQVFIPVNCAALPENIQESELFGHMKGAFTDAISGKKGLFEEAHGGTVFLDEIAEASLPTQAKLLRFLAEGEIRRVGGNTPVRVDVRLIAATSKDLLQAVEEKTFREDLYYRINVVRIHLPPIRERKDDIPLLAHHFVKKYAQNKKANVRHLSRETLALLMQYDWPGNVRELENAIQHAVAFTRDDTILPSVLPNHIRPSGDDTLPQVRNDQMSLYEIEKAYILQVLEEHSWDRAEAAAALGIGRATIYRKLKEYDFVCPPNPS
ncbi:sigma-54-dependent transcriptional regulator [Candidatus Poribacteria bacterium]